MLSCCTAEGRLSSCLFRPMLPSTVSFAQWRVCSLTLMEGLSRSVGLSPSFCSVLLICDSCWDCDFLLLLNQVLAMVKIIYLCDIIWLAHWTDSKGLSAGVQSRLDHCPQRTKNDIIWFFTNVSKGKVLPYSLLSVGPWADPGVQVVSPQVTWSHPPSGRLPLVSARPAVTFPAEECHRPSAGTKLYCLVREAHACEQLAQGCYLKADRPRFEPTTFWIASERSTVKPYRPHQC